MDLRSSARSRRSKSRTPFAMSESDQDLEEEKYSAVVYSENIKTSSTIVRSSNGKSSFERLSQEQNINSSNTKPVTNRRTKRFSKLYKTSDYSSEDGENEVSSTRSITENERNRMLEDARKAADSSTGITALGLYRKAKQYWEEYPKTDYTYSPFSKDRVEIAPGVVAMPNMSRRHISSYNKYTNTESFSTSELSNFLKTRQPSAEASSFYGVVRRNVLRVLVSILSVLHLFFAPVSHVYRFAHSVCVTLARCIYMATSAVMLLDTWLLRSNRNYGKAAALTALCVIPFLLIGGLQLYFCLVSGIPIAPSCYPNCGEIFVSYLKSMTNDFYSVFKTT